MVNRSPARHFLVKGQVAQNYCGGSRDTGAAVDEYFVVLGIHQVVEVLGSREGLLDVLILIVVVDRVVDSRFNSLLLVNLLHLCP